MRGGELGLMARARVRVETGYRGSRGQRLSLVVAELYDREGRLVWTDNTGLAANSLSLMIDEARVVASALTVVEQMGNKLAWDWAEAVQRAPRL